ncbi:MAG: hypothetical protein CMI53_02675 [Parcubacteria group bacterium]|jgi:putative endonuclease|nr:hypothetical protein [Parcubacteria group bacterium]|tara:strand:- start:211 stop:468 length:258 start_codon:yes stop_codon:yes gene_type:complete
MNPIKYTVYILKCKDGTLYTGYTVDLSKRVDQHNNSKKGARYTKIRRPVELIYTEIYDTKSEAMKREAEIKKYSRKTKLALIGTK